MYENSIDGDLILQNAIVLLEEKARGENGDNALQLALQIIRATKPKVSIWRSVTREPDEFEKTVFATWNELFGVEIGAHAQPKRLNNGILVVAVDSELWFDEIVRHRRKAIMGKLKAALKLGIFRSVSFERETPDKIHFTFTLPQDLFDVSAAPPELQEVDASDGDHLFAQQCVRDALQESAKLVDVEVSFEVALSIPRHQAPRRNSEHFANCIADPWIQSHYFDQLQLDLNWATETAEGFVERDGDDWHTALAKGLKSIAGMRWSRFKSAEESGDQNQELEMRAFAGFWYELAAKIRDPRSVD